MTLIGYKQKAYSSLDRNLASALKVKWEFAVHGHGTKHRNVYTHNPPAELDQGGPSTVAGSSPNVGMIGEYEMFVSCTMRLASLSFQTFQSPDVPLIRNEHVE